MQAIIKSTPSLGTLSENFLVEPLSPPPVPLDGEVVVSNQASTINIDDIHLAERTFIGGMNAIQGPMPTVDHPMTLGTDFAGVIEAVGPGVGEGWRVGQRVCGLAHVPEKREPGTWSTSFRTKVSNLHLIPDSMSFSTAAASVMPAFVISEMVKLAKIQDGDRILLIGSSGGIGTAAVQFLTRKYPSCHVVGVCSTKNEALVRSLGAHGIIDYTKGTYKSQLGTGAKFDVALDLVGGSDVYKAAKTVLKGSKARFVTAVGPIQHVGSRRLSTAATMGLFGSIFWREQILNRLPGSHPSYRMALPDTLGKDRWDSFCAASLDPVIARTISLDQGQLADSLKYVRSHRATGKVVIEF